MQDGRWYEIKDYQNEFVEEKAHLHKRRLRNLEIKALAAAIANHIAFLDAYGFIRRKFTKSQVTILMYHRVSPVKDSWSLEPLSPQEFERQITYFAAIMR